MDKDYQERTGNKLSDLYAHQKKQQQAAGCDGTAAGYAGIGDTTQNMACEENLLSRMYRRRSEAESDHSKVSHAIAILEKHPEFQDFYWLLRSNVL